ncbi:MAG: hypothetical protein ACT4OC_05810, partial [Bradyrhizobium sp.]
VGSEHAKHLNEHLAHGGILLWVRTRNMEHERKALDILRRHSAHDVHSHELPPAPEVAPRQPIPLFRDRLV